MEPIASDLSRRALWAAIEKILLPLLARALRLLKRKSPYRPTVICLKHRLYARERYYEGAFSSGRDVLHLSIMSESTLKEDMKRLLHDAQLSRTHVRVLTWDPPIDSTIEAFRRHLGEQEDHPRRTIKQVRQASKDWESLQKHYSDVLTVRKYASSPTMQGLIVRDLWALIELMPFNVKPKERPALVLTPKSDPDLFSQFAGAFELLWLSNP